MKKRKYVIREVWNDSIDAYVWRAHRVYWLGFEGSIVTSSVKSLKHCVEKLSNVVNHQTRGDIVEVLEI